MNTPGQTPAPPRPDIDCGAIEKNFAPPVPKSSLPPSRPRPAPDLDAIIAFYAEHADKNADKQDTFAPSPEIARLLEDTKADSRARHARRAEHARRHAEIDAQRRARRAMIAQEHADAIARAKRPPAPRRPLLPRLAPWIAPVLASLMLLLALTTCEDGYYILLRWVVFATAGWIALQLHKASRPGWFWIMLLLALLYNPLIPVHLGEAYTPRITRTTRLYRSRVAVEYADEDIWFAINLATIPLLLIATRITTSIRPDKTVPPQTTTTATLSTADSRHTPTNTGLTAPPPTDS